MAKPIEIFEGQKYGRWSIIKEAESHRKPNGKLCRMMLCNCECGNQSVVSLGTLRNGRSRSCGCYMKEVNSERIRKQSITHGITTIEDNEYKSLYFVWNTIKQRCYNQSSEKYKNYGGRGIRICDKWVNDFTCFKDWAINNGYYKQPSTVSFKDKLSIDRIDPDGDYTPENCRWITVSLNSSRRHIK